MQEKFNEIIKKVINYRISLEYKPRSDYCKIISSANRTTSNAYVF